MSPAAGGIRTSAGDVAMHLRTIVRLERELARAELRQRGGAVGGGVAAALAAAALAVFAVAFGLAAIAAAIAIVLDWWLALLLVFVLLLLLVAALLAGARSLLRRGAPLKPVQALAEAERTREALRGSRGG